MTAQAPALHRALAVLAPPRRFQLLLLLLAGPDRSVSQLARAVRLSQSCTTRHLQSLERAGLVRGERDGKRVVFRPRPRDAAARAVLGSLATMAGLAERTELEPVLAAGIALGAVPVASTAEREPLGEPPGDEPERAPEPAVAGPRAARRIASVPPPVAEGAHDVAESDMKSASRPSPFRQRTEIEDFLL